MIEFQHGDVAQMVERSLCMREVQGSIPCISNLFSLISVSDVIPARFIFSSQTTLPRKLVMKA